jgi:glutathione gamma-glutamylcysteinyltransferase
MGKEKWKIDNDKVNLFVEEYKSIEITSYIFQDTKYSVTTMSTANKLCKIIHCRVAFRKNTASQTILYSNAASTSCSVPSSSRTPSSSSTLSSLSHKRPFSSVISWEHHNDDENNHHNLDNYLDNVNRNNETPTTVESLSQQKSSYMSRNNNTTSPTTAITTTSTTTTMSRFPCGSDQHEDELDEELPPPLPEPKYTVHKRVLPTTLTAFSSKQGKQFLMEAFAGGTAESYWNLTEHFVNQSDPAFCGVTTLLMCLNALCIDPNIRWRGGWRFYGSEDVLLDRCCFSAERIRRKGIVMEDFSRLGRCHGLTIDLKRPTTSNNDSAYSYPPPQSSSHDNQNNNTANGDNNSDNDRDSTCSDEEDNSFSLDDFRSDIRSILSDTISKHKPILVVSFSRSALNQTGDGHFSPVGAYHEDSDTVLVLDVARFKYAPYWVSVADLYMSMQEKDCVTEKPRGWFRLSPPKNHECLHDDHGQENRLPVEFVPKMGEPEACPLGAIKIHFCKGNPDATKSPLVIEKRKSSIL